MNPNTRVSRRQILGWCGVAPLVPSLLSQGALAAPVGRNGDERVLVVIRLMGGNDGLNAVVPVRDDRYYRLRPTLAVPLARTILQPGGDRGLNPGLAAWHDLMQEGQAGILQGVGYARPSRSHLRATEIWETGTVDAPAPLEGWLGRAVDSGCGCDDVAVTSIQFASTQGRMLQGRSGKDRLLGDPELLLNTPLDAPGSQALTNPALARVIGTQARLADAARELRKVRRASAREAYPAGAFGDSLRWTADLIQSHSSARFFHLTLGSFETPASASFDTHVDQLDTHAQLYPAMGDGVRAFVNQLRRSGDLDRTLLLTVSDFGRHVAENRTRGTEHGDAGLMFYAGGRIRAGLTGVPADLGRVTDGGLDFGVDFRQVYAEVLEGWLGADAAALLGSRPPHAGILAT